MSKWALITGSSGGLGFEMAKILAEDQFNLILIDQSENNLENLNKMLFQINSQIKLHFLTIDLCTENAADEIYRKLTAEHIYPDVLINNAGFGTLGLFNEIPWEREKRMIRLHIETLTQLTLLFLKDMISRGDGKILNVASVAGFQPSPLMAVYNATKAYILSFTEAIAQEVKGTGVTVTVLCPGLTRTGFQNTVGVGTPDFTKTSWLSDSAENVAMAGIRAMRAGKIVVVPGLVNKFLANAHRFLPRNTVTGLVRKIQEKNRRIINNNYNHKD